MKALLTCMLVVFMSISAMAGNDNHKKIFSLMSQGFDAYIIADDLAMKGDYSQALDWFDKSKEHFQELLDLANEGDFYYPIVDNAVVRIDAKIENIERKLVQEDLKIKYSVKGS